MKHTIIFRGVAIHVYVSCLLPLLVYLPAGKAGLLIAAFSALMLHEAGHLLCAKKLKIHMQSIELLPYGCMIHFEGMELLPKKKRLLVLSAGPAVSLLLAICLSIFYKLMPLPLFLIRLMRCSLAIGLVNLLPMEPLDGGGIAGICLPEKIYILPRILSAFSCIVLLFIYLRSALSGRMEICLLAIAIWLLCGIFAGRNPLPMRALRAVMEKENRIRCSKVVKTSHYLLSGETPICRCLAYLCQNKYVLVYPVLSGSLLPSISERQLMEGYLAHPSVPISEMHQQ